MTLENFIRAETDGYFAQNAKSGFGVWEHRRAPTSIDGQTVIRMNRDASYCFAVLDLTSPATITLRGVGQRFCSLLVINQDQFAKLVADEAGTDTRTQARTGSRLVAVVLRSFVDPNDLADIAAANRVQDLSTIAQSDPGRLDLPNWTPDQRRAIRNLLNQLAFHANGKGA